MNKDVNSLRKCPSEELVFSSIALIGIFDSGNILSKSKSLLQRIFPDSLVILLAEVINLLPEGIHRRLLDNSLSGLLFLLFLLALLLIFSLLFQFSLSLLILLDLMDILFEILDGPSCGLCVLLIIVNIIVELYEFSVLPQCPFSDAVSVEIVFISLEVDEVLGNKVQMTQAGIQIALFEEGFSCIDDIPVVLQLIERILIPHE